MWLTSIGRREASLQSIELLLVLLVEVLHSGMVFLLHQLEATGLHLLHCQPHRCHLKGCVMLQETTHTHNNV